MKNILTSRIWRLTIICFFVLSLTAYLPAQQQSSPQPGIQGDRLVTKGLDQEDQNNFSAAFDSFTQACNMGNPRACGFLASMYMNGEGVSKNDARSAQLNQKACDGGVGWSCRTLSEMYSGGFGVVKDQVRAQQLARRASELPSTDPEVEARAAIAKAEAGKANTQACDSGAGEACMKLADTIYADARTNKDPRAEYFLQKGCDSGYGAACVTLGNILGNYGFTDTSRRLELYRKGCDEGEPDGCANLALCYSDWSTRLGLSRNDVLAQQFNQKACVLGATAYCTAPSNGAAVTQVASTGSQSTVQDDAQAESERQDKISQLQSDIDSQEQLAQNDESSANQLLNNCSGPGAALCQALGQAGAARLRQKAAEAKNQADSDREKIERLQGEEVQTRQRRDTTYGGSLQQVTTETRTSIQSAAAQQQANLQAMAAANQQRQQVQAQQQPAPSTSVPAARSSSVNTATVVPAATATPSLTASSGGNNPYSSAPAQGSYNPYTEAGSGSVQGSCTDMTGSVQGTVKIGSDGWVSGYLTNNSNQTLFVSYTFKQNGVPSTAMANSGGTTIQEGQTVGGEGQGLYSTGADKNPPEIYWYAVLKSDHDQYGCVHKW